MQPVISQAVLDRHASNLRSVAVAPVATSSLQNVSTMQAGTLPRPVASVPTHQVTLQQNPPAQTTAPVSVAAPPVSDPVQVSQPAPVPLAPISGALNLSGFQSSPQPLLTPKPKPVVSSTPSQPQSQIPVNMIDPTELAQINTITQNSAQPNTDINQSAPTQSDPYATNPFTLSQAQLNTNVLGNNAAGNHNLSPDLNYNYSANSVPQGFEQFAAVSLIGSYR